MQDLERGQRIKDARHAKRLTQPAVVQLLRERAGAEVVTLRGYQSWESGGGIRWENAKVLADVLGLDAERIMSGEPTPTPNPFAEPAADPTKVTELLESVHTLLQQQNELLDRQSAILERIEDAVAREDQTVRRDEESVRQLEAAVQQAREALRAASQDPGTADATHAHTRTR
jgi:transcriptional regulator with XRE-family HTH domain